MELTEATFYKHMFISILQFYVYNLESTHVFQVSYIFIDPWKTLGPRLVAAEFWPMERERKWWVPFPGLVHTKLLSTFLHVLFPFWVAKMEITSGDLTSNVLKMVEPPSACILKWAHAGSHPTNPFPYSLPLHQQ